MSTDKVRLVFHVGAAPTASWRLQRYLGQSEADLARAGRHLLPAKALSDSIGTGGRLLEDPSLFASELSTALPGSGIEMLVATHEGTIGAPFGSDGWPGLFPAAGPVLDRLAELTASLAPTIVLSVSPQAEFLESYYLRLVNTTDVITFGDWLAGLDLDRLSWLPLHAKLVDAFGADAVSVIDYRPTESGQLAFLTQFLELLEVEPPAPLEEAARSGPGISDRGLHILRAADPFLGSSGKRRALRAFVQKHFSGSDYPPPTLLTDERRSAVQERYRSEYEHLVAQPSEARAVGSASPDAEAT